MRVYGQGAAAEQITTYPSPSVQVVAMTLGGGTVERLASILHRDQLGTVRGLTG